MLQLTGGTEQTVSSPILQHLDTKFFKVLKFTMGNTWQKKTNKWALARSFWTQVAKLGRFTHFLLAMITTCYPNTQGLGQLYERNRRPRFQSTFVSIKTDVIVQMRCIITIIIAAHYK